MMSTVLALLAVLPVELGASHFALSASYVPPVRPGALAYIAVTFAPADAEIQLNQDPAPRLKLDPAQKVLVDRQPAASAKAPPPAAAAKYLDTRLPVSFPVALAPGAPRGAQEVRASVVYFYCSKREGWCRRGSGEVEVSVSVP
jgi:hypothetical protein